MDNEEEKEKEEVKGFAGLSSMASDVDAVVDSTPKKTQKASSDSATKQSADNRPQDKEEQPGADPWTGQRTTQPSGGSSAGKWLIGIAVVIGLIWLANQSDSNRPSRPADSPGISSTSVAPASQPAVVQPQAPIRPSESKPSVGRNNVLSTGQIRYCLAEKIRLDASEAVLNNYRDSDVDRFNGYVNDYNSRCGEFRYKQGALESARRDVEPYRGQLQADGRGRFVRTTSVATIAPSSPQAPKPARPTPDATVQAIQGRLNELGYSAGTPDGLFGNKTKAAIQAFERNSGLEIQGLANVSLLRQLESSGQVVNEGLNDRNTTSFDQGEGARGLPDNATLASWGSDWVCNSGYFKSGTECRAVQVPTNGQLASWGSDWVCNSGYYKSGTECRAVQVPTNGQLASWGSDWVCNSGYY
ncbi:MAG: hypothetical protein DRR42_13230, partial [Gammaproteobacteria bacterium]